MGRSVVAIGSDSSGSERDPPCIAPLPHHKRTRLDGEQRGTTVKVTEPGEAAPRAFAQVSVRFGRKMIAASQAEGPGAVVMGRPS